MKQLRVIQWTTGKVGKHAARAIIDDPRRGRVGLYARPAEKAIVAPCPGASVTSTAAGAASGGASFSSVRRSV